jgi:hypothetical protein
MAATINVACTLTVKVDVGSGLTTLGYTTEGAQISVRAFQTPVHTDENGGPAGPPVDIIQHGEIHTVSLELAKYDSAVMNVIETFRSGGTPGSVGSPCLLMKGDSKFIRLLLTGTNFTRNYVVAIPTGEIRTGPIGATATRASVSFDCHANSSGVIHNTTIV